MAVAIEKNLSRNKNTEAPFGRRDYQIVGKTEVLFGKADWPPGIARLSEAAQRANSRETNQNRSTLRQGRLGRRAVARLSEAAR